MTLRQPRVTLFLLLCQNYPRAITTWGSEVMRCLNVQGRYARAKYVVQNSRKSGYVRILRKARRAWDGCVASQDHVLTYLFGVFSQGVVHLDRFRDHLLVRNLEHRETDDLWHFGGL
jgi:hypothetical protein